MAHDQTKYTAWAKFQDAYSAGGTPQYSWTCEEGIYPSERGRDDTLYKTLNQSVTFHFVIPYSGAFTIPANSKFFVSVRGRGTGSGTGYATVSMYVDSATVITGANIAFNVGIDSTETLAFTVGAADITVYNSLVMRLVGVNTNAPRIFPFHDGTFVGFDTTGTGAGMTKRAIRWTKIEPLGGAHSNPTPLATSTPGFDVEAQFLYPWETLTLTKSTDTLSTAAHSASAPTEQSLGTVQSLTTGFPDEAETAYTSKRYISFSADATRKADTLTNTYYEAKAKQDTTVRGTFAYETRLTVERPSLTTLNGAAAGSYVTTTEPTPLVVWTNPNPSADRWQVRVYNTSDVLQHDSTETVSSANQYSLPNNLSNLTTLYVKVTVAKGTDWTVDSLPGYFQVDNTSTALKITSPAGTLDDPELITTQAPTVEWSFTKTQAAYNVVARNIATGAVTYESGWTASATESKTLPAATLALGVTYALQVQIKDNLGNIYGSDEQVYVHVNESSISAPALTAEPDTDTKTDVTVAWAAPTVNDSDSLTYDLELTRPGGQVETYDVGAAISFVLGRLSAGTYSWRVRAVDEHDLEGTWSAADSFVISQVGATPSVTLAALATSTTTTPRSTWTYEDLDGDAQDAYQIITASDAGFTADVTDSGTVVSTNQYYQHDALAAGTWYRKVRVRTNTTDWSSYDDDSFIIASPTVQSSEWQLYRTDGSDEINLTTAPISNVSVNRPLDAPASLNFTINNFSADEQSIDDDDDMVLKLKDSDGNLQEYRGQVVDKDVGLLLTVTAEDISRTFDLLRVTRRLGRSTTAEIIEAIVENPTGNAATGIVAHCEEIVDPDTAGLPIRFDEFIGGGKTVAQWLSDFQNASGFRWYVESISGTWHFHWFNPDTCPLWAFTLRDDSDYFETDEVIDVLRETDEPERVTWMWLSYIAANQWRILEGASVKRSRRNYANRIRFFASTSPPSLPEGYANFDELLTEATTDWTAYSGTTVSADAVVYVEGIKSIKCLSTQLSNQQIPSFVNLAYRKLPQSYRDMRGLEFGALLLRAKLSVDRTGGAETWGDVKPHLALYIQGGSSTGPTGGIVKMSLPLTDGQWVDLRYDILADLYRYGDASDVNAFGFRLEFHNGPLSPVGVGQTWQATVYLDDMSIQGKTPPSPQGFERFVETAAVTAGTEVPLEIQLSESNMPMAAIEALAKASLTEHNRTQETVSQVAIPGIRPVPMQVRVPLILSRCNLNGNYPIAAVEYKPLDSGWQTVLTLGDLPRDLGTALRIIKHKYQALDAERQQ